MTCWWSVATLEPREAMINSLQRVAPREVPEGKQESSKYASIPLNSRMTSATPQNTMHPLAIDHRFPRDVLRYLGHRDQEVSDDLFARVDWAIERCNEVARPVHVSSTYPANALPLKLPGASIAEHLEDAVEVVLFAATLGHGVDKELRRLGIIDPLNQVIFDAAATALIEREADKIEASLRTTAAGKGMYCSWRFSPGYGDLPLDVQPAFLATLNATRRLGITLTPSNLMVPTKSVTAIVGIHPTPQPELASSCAVCSLAEFCELRTRGLCCH